MTLKKKIRILPFLTLGGDWPYVFLLLLDSSSLQDFFRFFNKFVVKNNLSIILTRKNPSGLDLDYFALAMLRVKNEY